MSLSKIADVTDGKVKTTGVSPFSELELSKIYPNPEQPRKTFEDIEELAATIKEHGLMQPITVVKKTDGYMIISGERRYKAHLYNQAKTIKAYIIDATDEQVQEMSLIENIQRNDLTDFEVAKHIVKLWDSGRFKKKSDLAAKIGKSESYISKAFSSLKLDDEIIEDIETNKKNISVSVMDEISRVKDKTTQKEVYQKYSAGEITRDEIKDFRETKKTIEKLPEPEEIWTEDENDIKLDEVVNEKNFPRENLHLKTFELEIKDGDTLLQFDTIYAPNKNNALTQAYKRYPTDAADNYSFEITEVEVIDEDKYLKMTNQTIVFFAEANKINPYQLDVHHIDDGFLKAYFMFAGEKNAVEFDVSKEYKIIIQCLGDKKETATETKPVATNTNEIKLIELFDKAVTIEYSNDYDIGISYEQAKKIVSSSTQTSIPFDSFSNENRVLKIIEKSKRTIKDNCIVMKEEK